MSPGSIRRVQDSPDKQDGIRGTVPYQKNERPIGRERGRQRGDADRPSRGRAGLRASFIDLDECLVNDCGEI